jgi:hypothetical protein
MSGNSKNTGPKRSSSNRRYLIRVMRGDISPHDEVCQSRKQMTGGRGCIAIELAHKHLDRF